MYALIRIQEIVGVAISLEQLLGETPKIYFQIKTIPHIANECVPQSLESERRNVISIRDPIRPILSLWWPLEVGRYDFIIQWADNPGSFWIALIKIRAAVLVIHKKYRATDVYGS